MTPCKRELNCLTLLATFIGLESHECPGFEACGILVVRTVITDPKCRLLHTEDLPAHDSFGQSARSYLFTDSFNYSLVSL